MSNRSTVADGRDSHAERIVSSPGICGGQPRIAGTRIPVSVLLRCRAVGMSDERILEGYPALAAEDLAAAWRFADQAKFPASG